MTSKTLDQSTIQERFERFHEANPWVADELEKELPQAASYVHEAADRFERAASALRERSVDDLFRSVSDFARNQPATFFGSAVVAGFALSRFLKSSAGRQS